MILALSPTPTKNILIVPPLQTRTLRHEEVKLRVFFRVALRTWILQLSSHHLELSIHLAYEAVRMKL